MTKNLGIPQSLVKITDEPKESMYVYCGKPLKIKKLEEVVGKTLEINGKYCIITYPLNYLVEKGQYYSAKIQYCLEIFKNVMVVKGFWKYENGRITSQNTTR